MANRETGTLERVDTQGNVVLKLDKENQRIRFNLNEMKHLDYGYAVTSFSSQGTTVQKVLVNIATEDSRVRNLIDQRFGYVAVSRAELDAQIFTDNADKLSQALGRKHDNHQALSPAEVQSYRNEGLHNSSPSQNSPAPLIPQSHAVKEQRGQAVQFGA